MFHRDRIVQGEGPGIVLLVALPVCLGLLAACAGPLEQQAFDRSWLESVEDLSESLANDLLALSVALRDKDLYSIGNYFDERITASPLPVSPGPTEPVVKWVLRHGWGEGGQAVRTITRKEFLIELSALLRHFPVLEDARVKVKEAKFSDPATGNAQVKFFLIGRDPEGRREWLKGTGRIEVVRSEEGPWRIRRFETDEMESKLSAVDLFSEVALPARVAALFPPFGVPPNLGFAAHGAAAGDVNGDGLLDLAASGVEQNYLYINEGDGRFRDLSEESLVRYAPVGTGTLFLDYDNDGDQDLFFAAIGNQILLENRWIPDGEIRFWDVSETANVAVEAIGFSAVAADVNGDGYQDIYVASYNRYGEVMPNAWHRATNGTRNLLFLNRGDGTFLESAAGWGVDDSRWTYAAAFVDIDTDGDQDLYVANDFGENALYRNDGDRFSEVADAWGVVDPGFGMGISFGDYDNDGDLDLHVTTMSSTAGARILGRLYPEESADGRFLNKLAAGNSLYENDGRGHFEEVAARSGIFPAGWAFGGGFVDFDNDGWEDLYTPNGFISGKSMKDT